MEQLSDLLGSQSYKEPTEIGAIKKYVADKYKQNVGVTVRKDSILVTVHSSPLANTLRLQIPALQAACATDKKIVFRINP